MIPTNLTLQDPVFPRMFTDDQFRAIEYIYQSYYKKGDGVMNALEMSTRNHSFEPSTDANLNELVSANFIANQDDIHLSLTRFTSGSLSISCERQNDPIFGTIKNHPKYAEIQDSVIQEVCKRRNLDFE